MEAIENENPFIVKKFEVPVVIMFDVVRPKRENCLIKLNLTSRSGNGPESIKEYLENMAEFVPVRIGRMKKHSIVNSNSIIYVQEHEKSESPFNH